MLVFEKLDAIIRASSLVEMVNSFIRPSLHSCKGHITQEALHLIMFYHNHRRYKSGKRKDKAPIELLTGKPLQAEWVELFIQQLHREEDAETQRSLPPRPPLKLIINHDVPIDPPASLPCQASFATLDASVKKRQQTDAEAA